MNIVVLDGYAVNPGDLSWSELERLGNVKVYESTKPEQVIERAREADAIITNKVILRETEFKELPNLKYIGVTATGYNIIDIEAAKRRNIVVTNVPAYSTDSVAQTVFAFILEFANNVVDYSAHVMAGVWSQSEHFCFYRKPIIEIADKTLGIIGYGNIGKKVCQIANAFGMNVLVYSRTKPDEDILKIYGAKWSSIDEIAKNSDFISIHCPLTSETRNLIDAEFLRKMKTSAYLINTSRGAVINEKELAKALNEGIIAGAGLDVLSQEPPSADNPLIGCKNCFITPHIAWASKESRTRLMNVVVQNLKEFIEGKCVKNAVV